MQSHIAQTVQFGEDVLDTAENSESFEAQSQPKFVRNFSNVEGEGW